MFHLSYLPDRAGAVKRLSLQLSLPTHFMQYQNMFHLSYLPDSTGAVKRLSLQLTLPTHFMQYRIMFHLSYLPDLSCSHTQMDTSQNSRLSQITVCQRSESNKGETHYGVSQFN